ncbi:hypothetical protein MRB53_039188 [Persea americana]|nr:hypothetical protein MRB53_039188 [Persea americana]
MDCFAVSLLTPMRRLCSTISMTNSCLGSTRTRPGCQGMQDLKVDFLHPLLEQFGKDSKAQDEYSDLQTRLKRLRTALSNPLPDEAAMTENVVKKLNLSARRPGPKSNSIKSKTRYKREHTL